MFNMKKPCFCLSLIMFLFSILSYPSLAALTSISTNQSLSGDQTLISEEGIFELGFFKPGNYSNYYIGIWYKKISIQTIVWVANRDNPVSDKNTATLRILAGNLVLLDESSKQVWSTSMSSPNSGSVVAILLDTGNLVLRNRPDDDDAIDLWHSFDHPTDTWLPGGKIRLDNKTKKPQYLTSWKSSKDPSTGLFSLELDPNGTSSCLLLWNKSEVYWTSGSSSEMESDYGFNFSFVSNENQNYLSLTTMYVYDDDDPFSQFVMDVSGHLNQLTWMDYSNVWMSGFQRPSLQCDVYGFCGAYGSCYYYRTLAYCSCLSDFEPKSVSDWNLGDYSGGCMRKTRLQCEGSNPSNGNKDMFLAIPYMGLPNHAQFVRQGNASECESACWKHCSCTAYAYNRKGCSIWFGDLMNLQQVVFGDNSTGPFYLKLAAPEFRDSSKNNNHRRGVIGVLSAVVVIGVFLAILLFFLLRRRKRVTAMGKLLEGFMVEIGYKDLQKATKNFSEKLGGGGFGSVFKGTLADLSMVAVKKLESISQGEKQFRAEVSAIGTVQHVNLVRLRGFCSEGTQRMLVYDYMPNGSLDFHLFLKKYSSKVLDWKMRYEIALGIARGLTYLHEKCRYSIIHCDVKPENILLDANFCPKVADFGLAKLVGRDFSRVLTTVRGTIGYLAPEWISGVAITAKADVYSYGKMLFEVVSGRRNSGPSGDSQVSYFPTIAAKTVIEGGSVITLLDPILEGNADIEEVARIIKVASWCVQDNEIERPTMGQVVQILEGILEVNLPPIPRSLQMFVDNHESIIFHTDSSSTQSLQVKSNI